jgi:hypothetical protein
LRRVTIAGEFGRGVQRVGDTTGERLAGHLIIGLVRAIVDEAGKLFFRLWSGEAQRHHAFQPKVCIRHMITPAVQVRPVVFDLTVMIGMPNVLALPDCQRNNLPDWGQPEFKAFVPELW